MKWFVLFLFAGCALAFGQNSGTITISGTTTNAVAVDDGLRCHDFCVEKLTEAEIAKIALYQKKLDAAQSDFNATMVEVENAHGKADGHNDLWRVAICWPYDSVEIRGKYALITYHFQSCVGW